MFEYKLQEWLKENGFECAIQFGDDFAYDRESNVLQVGCVGYPIVCRWFEQFLYEYGLEYKGIYDPVLALLHELGHSMTLDQFSERELRLFDFSKFLLEDERMTNSNKSFNIGLSLMSFLLIFGRLNLLTTVLIVFAIFAIYIIIIGKILLKKGSAPDVA